MCHTRIVAKPAFLMDCEDTHIENDVFSHMLEDFANIILHNMTHEQIFIIEHPHTNQCACWLVATSTSDILHFLQDLTHLIDIAVDTLNDKDRFKYREIAMVCTTYLSKRFKFDPPSAANSAQMRDIIVDLSIPHNKLHNFNY